jgi:hypothetical protein
MDILGQSASLPDLYQVVSICRYLSEDHQKYQRIHFKRLYRDNQWRQRLHKIPDK